MTPARILTVAGSDSSGGAGIEADIKTIERLGGYAMAAVTAVTAQNTLGVQGIWSLPPEAIEAQIRSCREDIGIDAAKCGMLGGSAAVEAAAEGLQAMPGLLLVVDPVMRAKGGQRLLAPEAEEALRRLILPLATLVTPNLPEAAALVGRDVATSRERERAAQELVEMGAGAALIKGGHGDGDDLEDILYDGSRFYRFRARRIATRHTHGTGCTLSAAIATGLGQGLELPAAVARGVAFVQAAIRLAPGLGGGHGPLDHHAGQPAWEEV